MTREETIKLLQFLNGCYSKKIEDPRGMIDAFMMVFADADAGDVYKAARYHMTNNKFFPTPADLNNCMFRAKLLFDVVPESKKLTSGKEPDAMDVDYLAQWLFQE